MAVNIEKFELDKNVPVGGIRRFFEAHQLDFTQVLDVSVIQKTPNASVYLLTYEDVVAPYVTGTSPMSGSSGVPIGSLIVIQMSEPVANVVGTDLTVWRDAVEHHVPDGDITTAGSMITIANVIDAVNTSYSITLLTSVTDLAGNHMLHNYHFSFSSATGTDTTVFKGGVATPGAGDILAGFIDVAFAVDFAILNYRIGLTLVGANAQPGVVLRASNKLVSGFRINFDVEDFSTVETGIDAADAALSAAIDAAHTAQINTQHANPAHAAPQNALVGLITVPPGGAACADRAFIANNTIEWTAIWNTGF